MVTLSTIGKKSSTDQSADGSSNTAVYQVSGNLRASSVEMTVDYMVSADLRTIGVIKRTSDGKLGFDSTPAQNVKQAGALARIEAGAAAVIRSPFSARRTSVPPDAPVIQRHQSDFPEVGKAIWKG
jgi:hypothetical protein